MVQKLMLKWGALFVVAAGVVACGSTGSSGGSGGSPPKACTPGTQQACACLGGTMGIQDCNATGSAFGTCQCGAGGGTTTGTTSGTTTSTSASSGTGGSTGTCQCTNPDQEVPPYCGMMNCNDAGAGGACAGHINYAGLYPAAPSIWAGLPNAGGLTSLDAGNAQCKALGIGADHVCDLTEVQAANNAKEALFMAIPAGTTAWMERTTPAYVEGLSGTPCTAAMVGMSDGMANPSCYANAASCGADSDCCSGSCTGGTCAAGAAVPASCLLSQPGAGGRCNNWQYGTHHIGDGEYIVFGSSGGVPTGPGLPANPGDPGFHYDNDTNFNPNQTQTDNHHSSDFGCNGEMRAILCCYESCSM